MAEEILDAEEKFNSYLRNTVNSIRNRRTQYWTPAEGTNLIRVLRKTPKVPWFFETVVHYGLGPEGKDRCVCLKQSGKECPVCLEVNKLRSSSRKSDQERAEKIKPSRHYLMNIINLKDLDKGVQIFRSGETILVGLSEIFFDADYGDFTHPKQGFNVKITRHGMTKNDTEYSVRPARNSSSIPDMGLLKQLKDLSTVFPFRSADEVRSLLDDDSEEGSYECFGKDYDKSDEICDECVKSASCKKAFFAAKRSKK